MRRGGIVRLIYWIVCLAGIALLLWWFSQYMQQTEQMMQ